jgi:1-acyl-sn-glycerol-3-phosphate acyltransferase
MKEEVNLYRIVRPVLAFLIRILYWPIIIGKENIPASGKCLLAGTHIYDFDPILIMASTKRNVYFIAKKELHDSKLGFIFKACGTIPVDRSKKNPNARIKAEEALNEGKIIGIFPEGTTKKKKGVLLPFKYGAVSMAQKTNSKIVPFAIVGDYKLFGKIKIVFDKPFSVKNMELDEANELLRNKVIKLIEKNK